MKPYEVYLVNNQNKYFNHMSKMMNTIRKIILTILFISISSTVSSESAGEHIDDATIASKIKTTLIRNKNIPARKINVEVSRGVVQLSGFLKSEITEAEALKLASSVSGVKKILDALVVLPNTRSVGETVDDTTIAAKLKTKLAQTEGLANATAINIEINQGIVLLAGFVENETIKSDAGKAARSISGVTQVHNLIAVK